MEQNNITSVNDMERIKRQLIESGSTAEEADNQIGDLVEIITLSIAKRISQEIIDHSGADFAEIRSILEARAHDPLVAKIIKEESTKITEGYLAKINENIKD